MAYTIKSGATVGYRGYLVKNGDKSIALFYEESEALSFVAGKRKQPPKLQTLDEMEADNPDIFKNPL